MNLRAIAKSYILRRFLALLLVIWMASTLMFFLPRFIEPRAFRGQPVPEGSQRVTSQFERRFGFSNPLWVQYRDYMFSLARFDLGYSSRFYPVRVTELISASVVWTAALMGVTTLIAFVAGSLLGAFLGWAHAPAFAKYVALPAMVLSVVPYYLLGLILRNCHVITASCASSIGRGRRA
jgi:peptide/nickel transport system permease protein